MIMEGIFQFLAAFAGTIAFSVLFSVPREHYPLCGFIGGTGWLICWCFVHCFHTGAIEANFAATVFITLASRIGSTIRKCPVTLFLIAGIFPEVPGIGIYRTVNAIVPAKENATEESMCRLIRQLSTSLPEKCWQPAAK